MISSAGPLTLAANTATAAADTTRIYHLSGSVVGSVVGAASGIIITPRVIVVVNQRGLPPIEVLRLVAL